MERGCGHEVELEALRRENTALKQRVAELERLVADLQKKLEEALRAQKRQAAPFSKGPPQTDPKRPGRKPGEHYGIKAHRQPPPTIDEIIPVALPEFCECGGEPEFLETAHQYQTEIPRRPIYRRFDIALGRCRRCGRQVQGRHPLQTSDALGAAASQIGPDAQAMTALLKDKLGVSYGDIQTVLSDFFQISLTRGGASHIVLRTGQRVDAAYQGIKQVMRQSRAVYPDETGWKVRGLLQWMWVFVEKTVSLFVIRPSRGYDVPTEILGADYSGDMIHDGWGPYDRFTKAHHQQCLQHLIRRAKLLIQTGTRGAVRFPRAVLEILQKSFVLRDRRDAKTISPHGLAVAIGQLQSRLEYWLGGRFQNTANFRFAKHLWSHRNDLFLFLRHPGIEATSWPADHAIRPAVVNRKVFGGNREPSGAEAQERLASIAATCAQRGVAVFQYLSQVLRATSDQRDRLACHLLQLPAPT
ncbi:MAG: IS66 family transposase [Planctomycetes bacterium]|nr:IS66 family transposase [Planctomycetota bacterium]